MTEIARITNAGQLTNLAPDQLLAPSEVAALFGVEPKTVARWSRAGKLVCIYTPGGHRRYRVEEIRAMLERAR